MPIKLLGSNLSYAQFQALQADIGAIKHLYYRSLSGNITFLTGVFEDRFYTINTSIDPPVAVSALTADYPMAVEAYVSDINV